MTTTEFEKLTDTTYHTTDWSMLIEFTTEHGWMVTENCVPKQSFETLEQAMEWAARFRRGEVLPVHGWSYWNHDHRDKR